MPHGDIAGDVLIVMGGVKLVIAILGALIAYFALKAYRRTGDRSFGLLAAGFAFVTTGAILGGISFELLRVELATGVLIEGIFVAIGFVLIAYSLRIPAP